MTGTLVSQRFFKTAFDQFKQKTVTHTVNSDSQSP